jgi:gluconate 5-dehydrogenase
LGSALARALAEAGASVVLTSRDESKAQAAARELPTSNGARHWGIGLDHMTPESLPATFARIVSLAGRVDILVNNGHEAQAADWTTRLVRNHAVENARPASIVLLGSMYGVVGSYPEAYADVTSASPVAYHTLKGGIVHMTRHLAVYWAPDNVRVNCLSPGPFPRATAPAGMVERLREKSPLRRMGAPHELKGALIFLASDASSYVTGQNLIVDGGWTAW